jgi:hypothetical protein
MARSINMYVVTAMTLVTAAGAACGQAVTYGGLHHEPFFGASVAIDPDGMLRVGGLADPEAGVEVACLTRSGLGLTSDLSEFFGSPGAMLRHRYKGWDGTIKGRMEMECTGPGAAAMVCDYSSLGDPVTGGVRAIRWVVRDRIGDILASGETPGPSMTCLVYPGSGGGSGGSAGSMLWSTRTRINELETTLKNLGILARCENGVFVVDGLGSPPVEHAASIEFFPILCITSPCPGDWTDLSAVEVTASGLPSQQLSMRAPELVKRENGDLLCGYTSHFRSMAATVSGQCSVEDFCDMPPPVACAPEETALRVSNIGSSGQDGVEIHFDRTLSERSGVLHRDIAAFSGGVSMTLEELAGATGSAELTWKGPGRPRGGHVTVLKMTCTPNGSAGGVSYAVDATAQGATVSVVDFVDVHGTVIHTAEFSATDQLLVLQRLGGDMQIHGDCTVDGAAKINIGGNDCVLPDGSMLRGVWEGIFRPSSGPWRSTSSISSCDVRLTNLASATIREVRCDAMTISGGQQFHAEPGSCVIQQDGGRVSVRPSSTGSSSVRMITGGEADGGVQLDLAQLAASGGEIKIKHKGWDGTIYHRLRLSSPPGTGVIIEEHDLTGLGIAGFDWRLRGVDGAVLAQGFHAGEVVSWALSSSSGGSISKVYVSDPGVAGRSAGQGFFDFAINVSGLGSATVAGVHAIDLDPVECAGCPPLHAETRSMDIEADGVPDLVIAGLISAGPYLSNSDSPWKCVLAGTGSSLVTSPPADASTRRGVVVRNIGSSGEDGVEVNWFQTGDRPTQEQFFSSSVAYSSDGWAGGGAGGSFVNVEFRAPNAVGGHVTVLKLSETTDEGLQWYAPDFSSLGVSEVSWAALNAAGELTDSGTGPSDLRFGVPRCDQPVTVRCDSSGGGELVLCPSSCVLPNGTVRDGVSRITFAPIGSLLGNTVPTSCVIAGRNVDEIVVHTIGSSDCPGDFNGDGGVDGDDVISFFGLWDAGELAGDFNHDGSVDGDDVISFFGRWDSGC